MNGSIHGFDISKPLPGPDIAEDAIIANTRARMKFGHHSSGKCI